MTLEVVSTNSSHELSPIALLLPGNFSWNVADMGSPS